MRNLNNLMMNFVDHNGQECRAVLCDQMNESDVKGVTL